jgi:hypothetical protein
LNSVSGELGSRERFQLICDCSFVSGHGFIRAIKTGKIRLQPLQSEALDQLNKHPIISGTATLVVAAVALLVHKGA